MNHPDTDTSIYQLLRTKLHRPRMIQDLVGRPRLLERLEQRRQRPLMLVSAPAGYGKTTLISSWLETNDWRSAWLSLDAQDDDLSLFLAYLIAAIQTIFHDACLDTQALLRVGTLPPLSILSMTLINELDQIEKPFILVLDDYHHIQNIEIHDLISELLVRPPLPMHLVLVSRIDPPLNLARYRALRQVTEIRTQELRFTETETAEFLKKELGTPPDERTVADLFQRVEGWVTGMRLFTLTLRHRGSEELVQAEFRGSVPYITEYLMGEVLDNQPAAIQDYLLHSAILDRFCAPLCQVVSPLMPGKPYAYNEAAGAETRESDVDSERFLEWLTTNNLFIIPLDDQRQWYRYHHLFQEILRDLLAKRLSSDDIAVLHRRASLWLAENGLVDEALYHALTAGDITMAAELVKEGYHELMNQEQWHVLEHWLDLLPQEAVEGNAKLLLARAWLLDFSFKHEEILPLLERVKEMIGNDPSLADQDRLQISGEISVLYSSIYYWAGLGQLSLENAKRAVDVTPIENRWVRGLGLTYLIGAYQLVGQLDRTYEEANKILAAGGELAKKFAYRAYDALVAVEALAGNLNGLEDVILRQLELTKSAHLHRSLSWAQYGLAFIHYQRNNLVEAKVNFTKLVEMRFRAHAGAVAQGYYGLALTYHALGDRERAREASQAGVAWATEMGNLWILLEAQSLISRLAFLEGQIPDTNQWSFLIGEDVPLMALLQFPHLTLVNVLLAQATPDALHKADDLLVKLRQAAESTYNTWRMMEITAMQAVLKEAQGEKQAALNLLEPVLDWAEPRGYIRLFADLGHRMAGLLEQLHQQGVAPDYLVRILAAFRHETKDERQIHQPISREGELAAPVSSPPRRPSWILINPLTNRELEVLVLLEQGLSNKEIAEQLVLTPGSVKQYTHRIYKKLDVKNRHQAVRTASDLGLLPTAAV